MLRITNNLSKNLLALIHIAEKKEIIDDSAFNGRTKNLTKSQKRKNPIKLTKSPNIGTNIRVKVF